MTTQKFETSQFGDYQINTETGMLVLPENCEVEVRVEDTIAHIRLYEWVSRERTWVGKILSPKFVPKAKRVEVARAVRILEYPAVSTFDGSGDRRILAGVAETLRKRTDTIWRKSYNEELKESASKLNGVHRNPGFTKP